MHKHDFDVILVHLLNDNSGSPQVLSNTIHSLKMNRIKHKLYIGSDGAGILSSGETPIKRYWYKRMPVRALTLFTYLFSQIVLFFQLLLDRSISSKSIIFVNTLLPFGAAIYGKLTNRRIIYHIHEVSITPQILKCLLIYVNKISSSFNLYVSDTHKDTFLIKNIPSERIYNSLNLNFIHSATESIYKHKSKGVFTVLMIASLREYKGLSELFNLAESFKKNRNISFELLVNDEQNTINRYCSDKSIPSNLAIYPRTSNTISFYKRASLLLNLSRVDMWVETFGMTILEAMAFGIPVIVPPIGGPSEIVENGVEGFHIDSRNHQDLYNQLLLLYNEEELCLSLSKKGKYKAKQFSPEAFSHSIMSVIRKQMELTNEQ